MQTRHRATLLDGISARGRPGMVYVLDDQICFTDEQGAIRRWNVIEVSSVRKVASELHVELAPVAEGVSAKLVADSEELGREIEEACSSFASVRRSRVDIPSRRLPLWTWLLIAACVVPGIYVVLTRLLPRAHVLVSLEAEARLGEHVFESLPDEWKVLEDALFAELTQRMLEELADPAARFDLRVTLVESDMPNAFALPGGRIVLFTGMLRLCADADVLAGVLAHELAHVEQRHSLKQLLRTAGIAFFAGAVIGGGLDELSNLETLSELSSGLLVLKHSRDHEREADRIAVTKLERAGRSAAGLVEFFESLENDKPGLEIPDALFWASTHPLTKDRITAARARISTSGGRPWTDPSRFDSMRSRICGSSGPSSIPR